MFRLLRQLDSAVFVSAFMVIVGWWIVTLAIMGRMSGWRKLARRYPARDANQGVRIWIRKVWFRWGGYGNLVSVKADESHLHFRMIARVGNPPFSVPWTDVSAKRIKHWRWINLVQFNFAGEPNYPFKMPGVTANRIIEASRGRAAITLVVLALLEPTSGMAQAPTAQTVPLCPGLTIVTAISDQNGDYESIKTVEAITEKAVSMKFSAEMPLGGRSGEPGRVRQIRSSRTVPMADLASSMRYARMFGDTLPASIPGTTALGTSRAVLTQLKTQGEAVLAVPDEGPLAMIERSSRGQVSAADLEFSDGTIRRVGTTRVKIPVVVNDVRVGLPAIHARGEFFGEPAEFFFLDDPSNPIALRYAVSRGEFSDLLGGLLSSLNGGGERAERDTRDILNVVKIAYRCTPPRAPTPAPPTSPLPTAGAALEKALTESGRADVYSIFFSFNSDRIREESDATIAEIAAVLTRHPDWTLSIEGHTDSIGSDRDNLDLSRRRAAAVRETLISRHRIGEQRLVTTGHGESRPRDTNETLHGRARNRRVELVRVPSA